MWIIVFQSLYHTAVWLIFVLSVIAYSNRQDLAGVAFQCLRVVSVLELLYGSMGGPVIFEFHHKSRSVCRGQRQEHDIRKAMTGGQFTDKPVILSRAVVGKSYGTGERIFIVVGQSVMNEVIAVTFLCCKVLYSHAFPL